MRSLSSRTITVMLLVMAVIPLSACLFRTRKIDRRLSTAPLKTSTQQDLIAFVNQQAARLQSLQATVDINTSVGDEKKGQVTDYQEIRGYVLARKPSMLRMKGLFPVVRNTAFDMVSNGQDFKLWIPPKNKFVIGSNTDQPLAGKRLENIRPQHIYEALLPREISPDEIAVLENGYETVVDEKKHRVDQPDYELAVIQRGANGWFLSRKIMFSRNDLLPHRQVIYDHQGNIVTDARYDKYKSYDGIEFPDTIEIERPQEDYDITLSMVKVELNHRLNDDQFALEQPAGAEVVHLGQSNGESPQSSNAHSR